MNKLALRTHFKALLNRSDITDALADTFIDMGITRIQRNLRVPFMEKQATYPISAATASITLPGDFLEIIDIIYGGHSLDRLTMREMQLHLKTAQAGSPHYFTRQGGSFLLHPTPSSGTVTLNYYASFPDMVIDTDESTLAKVASDLIIYASLAYSADYYIDERAALFEGKYSQFLSEITEQAIDAESVGTVQAIRPHVYFDME